MNNSDAKREMLRHTLATLAYRGGKAVANAPEAFATFGSDDPGRTPVQILAHIGDLFDWAYSIAVGAETWKNATPLPWNEEVSRFFSVLEKFDSYLASDAPLHAPVEKLFQGPVADALTHVGQIAILRRISGAPIKGENYFVADIVAGRVSADQAEPRFEF